MAFTVTPGQEADDVSTEEGRVLAAEYAGMFCPHKYHWLFFSLPAPNMKEVLWGQVIAHALQEPLHALLWPLLPPIALPEPLCVAASHSAARAHMHSHGPYCL